MPWKEQNKVEIRKEFIQRYQAAVIPFKSLCQEYGISTKTGYKWVSRYREEGYKGLEDMTRRPKTQPHQLNQDVIFRVINLKHQHMSFGPRKIQNLYSRQFSEVISESSVKRILQKVGLYHKRKTRHIDPLNHKKIVLEAVAPNDIWTIDFKGHWRGRGGGKCEPFTVVDQYSRYILHCLPLAKSDTEHVQAVFIQLFKKYGLPKVIKSDNGPPFANNYSVRGITRLTVWLIGLGVQIHRIQPASPSQNGKHERMHRDLKRVVQNGSQCTLKEYSIKLADFQNEYNNKRPHESLGMQFPCEIYCKSERKYKEIETEIGYPDNFDVRKVDVNGNVCLNYKRYKISSSLKGYHVGIIEIKDHEYDVYYCNILLGKINEKTKEFIKIKKALQVDENGITSDVFCGTYNLKVLPMC